MSSKVTVIGSGSVGSTIAYTMAVQGIASEIVIIDINIDKSLGEALDIRQGTPFCGPVNIYAGTYEDTVGSDIVVITSGVARKVGQSRLDLAQTNVNIMKQIIPQITKAAPDAVYVVVANPVDILTYQFTKYSGIPKHKIIGSGTLLDTARLRSRLAECYKLDKKNMHAYVMGEHGDSSFIPWSLTNICNIPYEEVQKKMTSKFFNVNIPKKDEIETYIRKSGGKIIARKGATFYAVAISVCHLCRCILQDSHTALCVSTILEGEYGIEDSPLSILTIVGKDGVMGHLLPNLNEEEQKALEHSRDCLDAIISKIDF